MMRFAVGKSDLLTVLRAYEGWREARKAGRGSERLYLEEVCRGRNVARCCFEGCDVGPVVGRVQLRAVCPCHDETLARDEYFANDDIN
jgi:hypothetical protein